MELFKTYDRFNYKYRLLYCLMLNYYRNNYADNKFKGKILVICSCKKELIKNYDKIYFTIKRFKSQDIETLKKFISEYDFQLKKLFDKLDNKNISYEKIIRDLKKEYIQSKSTYKQYWGKESYNVLPEDKNIIFMEQCSVENIYNKYLVRDIFIPEYYSMDDSKAQSSRSLCYPIECFVRDIMKTKDILKINNADEPEFLSLSVFIDSDNSLDIEDEIETLLQA